VPPILISNFHVAKTIFRRDIYAIGSKCQSTFSIEYDHHGQKVAHKIFTNFDDLRAAAGTANRHIGGAEIITSFTNVVDLRAADDSPPLLLRLATN
jgi:hypothetical protein